MKFNKITKDNKLTGFLCGLISPLIFIFLFWLFTFRSKFPNFDIQILIQRNQAAPLLGLGQIANALLFFYFIKKWDADESAKGVILAMLVYGAAIIFFKIYSGTIF